MFEFIKDNWKWLARRGWELIIKNHVPKLAGKNPFLGRVITQLAKVGDKSADIITDDNPKDVEQLRAMLCQEYPDLLEVVLAGAADYLPTENAKRQAIAILTDTAARIAETLPKAPTS
jgi:hypothetical protein